MRFFGIDINLGKNTDKTIKDMNNNIEKAYNDSKFGGNFRATMDYIKSLGGDEVRIPYYPLHERTLFDISIYSDIIKIIHMQLRKEIFRHGYNTPERFANKCAQCNKEFKHPVDKCDECNSLELKKPDINQKEKLIQFIKKCNDNDQDILDVSGEVNDDLETVDDGYMLLIKDYYIDNEGEIKYEIPIELIRVHPMHIRIIADRTGRPGRTLDGIPIFTCVNHRTQKWHNETHCPICGTRLRPAYYRGETYEQQGTYIYYIKGEVHHKSKYKPSLTYGFPPILSCWLKVTTLMSQDRYINTYYTKQRPPRGLLFVNTPNMESVQKAWNWMIDKFKNNPHTIPPIAVEAPEGHRGKFVEFIDFMKTLDEMQFIESRNEFRRQIGAIYGVQPLFMADTSTSGGLNNEGLQITVTNRSIEDGQGIFNDGFYPWLLEQLEITDYYLVLEPSEEKDEMAEEQLKMQKATRAFTMQRMGFEVTLNEDEEFEFEPTEIPVQPPQQQIGGTSGLGGFGGEFGGLGAKPSSNIVQPKMPGSQQRFAGEPENVERSIIEANKESAPVTSATSGTYNPVYSHRRKEIERYMQKVLNDILKEEKLELNIEKQNEGIEDMIKFIEESLYSRNFEGVNKTISDRIKDYILTALRKGYPIARITDYIDRKAGIGIINAESIARTEVQALQNAAREWGYIKIDPDEKLKYKWLGPADDRTTEICDNIKKRTVDGVPLDELRGIVKEESIKGGFDGSREWTPHINCRHTFVRAI